MRPPVVSITRSTAVIGITVESAEEMKRDLAITMFVAKKVVRLRDARARA